MLDSNSATCQLANRYFSPRKRRTCSQIQLGRDLEVQIRPWHGTNPSLAHQTRPFVRRTQSWSSLGARLAAGTPDSWSWRYQTSTHRC